MMKNRSCATTGPEFAAGELCSIVVTCFDASLFTLAVASSQCDPSISDIVRAFPSLLPDFDADL
jgi:hypothetical protein